MTVKITFDVFSGRLNPSVVLNAKESKALLAQIGTIAKPTAKAAQSAIESSALGYRGLVVEQTEVSLGNLPQRFRISGGVVSTPAVTLKTLDSSIDESVLGNAALLGRAGITAALANIIRSQSAALTQPTSKSKPTLATASPLTCRCAPLYEPTWWNDGATGGTKQFNNNCYNYASDYRTDTFAQPGQASSAVWTALTCVNVGRAALVDGLQDVKVTTIACPGEGHLVALVMWQTFDYHWYRMGRDGFWTHKPGGMPVTNVDNSGKLITDPRTANRGPYTGFCGFMNVMHGHIKLK